MNFGRAEILKLRASALLCVALIAAGGALVALTHHEKKKAAQTLAAAQARQNQDENHLRQVSNEEQEIKQKSALFQELRERGIIGTENRLDWVELLREVRDRHKLYAVDYEISPQQKLEGSVGGYEFQASTMKLDLRLLHEEDLLRLLADLQRNARALIVPRECTLSRLPRNGPEPAGQVAHIKANCTLQWITIRAPQAKP